MKSLSHSIIVLFYFFVPLPLFAFEPAEIDAEIQRGNFDTARSMINPFILTGNAVPLEQWNMNFQKERMDRIEMDFGASPDRVLNYIRRYIPDVTPEQLAQWKKTKALETMTINGEERFYNSAADNLFRIDSDARQIKLKKEGSANSLNDFLRTHLTAIHSKSKESKKPTGLEPQTFTVTYTLTVPADTVPEGEAIRCWLPYPRNDHRRQTDVALLDSNLENPIFSPQEYKHCTVYSEKIAVKGEPTKFQIKFQYKGTGEWFDPNSLAIKPYDKESELYKHYTAQRKEHVIFTEEIKHLSQEFVGVEKEPLQIVRKIYKGITTSYPWARAREYSTIPNIPSYVIENKHGDCGMVALLLITLCRYNGIPAKWQSGFMVHPNNAGMHDWAEVYFEGIGWIPIDASFGGRKLFDEEERGNFFMSGMDSYRLIVNEDYSAPLYPAKIFPRSETVDFQRGEVEWRGGNLYFNQWRWNIDVE